MIRIFLSTLARAAGAALLAFTAVAHAVTLNNSFGAQPFLAAGREAKPSMRARSSSSRPRGALRNMAFPLPSRQ